ncbi:hypothetical protein RchiOBHm_Chr3g0466511 [Rosa chinensis]|uniref:Uncharacterized protein n=1 Tax=Rosa chinensis TaxID=74649 RepID=A0A2P6R9Z8_ROSCH|nr:hypothetical protein RchiOBHm_Chr3g0466511 [Rosa chinensis]
MSPLTRCIIFSINKILSHRRDSLLFFFLHFVKKSKPYRMWNPGSAPGWGASCLIGRIQIRSLHPFVLDMEHEFIFIRQFFGFYDIFSFSFW